MGALLSDESAKAKEEQSTADIEMLMAAAENKKEQFRQKMISYYQNPEEFEKYEVVGGKIVAESTMISCTTEEQPNPDIVDGVMSMINGLFGEQTDEKGQETDKREQFRNGCTSLVKAAFAGVLGETNATSSENTDFFIVPYGYTFYRIDVSIWKFNVNSKSGVYSIARSSIVTVATTGILDTSKFTINELIGFIQQIVGTEESDISKWMEDYKEIVQQAVDVKTVIAKAELQDKSINGPDA